MSRWNLLLTAALLGLGTAGFAQDADVAPTTAVKPVVAVLPTPVADSDVAPFYAAPPGLLVWLRDETTRAGATKLVEVLKRAPIDGFAIGPALASSVEAA